MAAVPLPASMARVPRLAAGWRRCARRRPLLLALGALGLACAAPTLAAQRPPPRAPAAPDAPRLATLALWADDVWLALTDRDGSYFGRLADEGTFQRFNTLMDEEYELDLWTGLFTPAEDARWAAAREGLRVAGASINHPFILNGVDWREAVSIAGPVALLARYRRQRSLTAQRDYLTLAVGWGDALGSRWTVAPGIGVHFFKPSADLGVAFARAWGDTAGAGWTVDVRLALLDTFSDVIFQGLGVDPAETPAHFDYRALPLAARLAFGGAGQRWRGEVHAGVSTRSRVLVSFPAGGDPSYELLEQVSFVGAVGEVSPSGRLAVAAYGAVAQAATDRRYAAPSAGDLRLRERTAVTGLRGRLAAGAALAWELDLRVLWRPEDREAGDGTRVRHRDRERFAQLALARRPAAGWTWRLALAHMDREAGLLAPGLTATHQRQVIEGGYRFRSAFEVAGGVRWDVDQFARSPFDGGHLRFVATW